jgi:hypothetical protein
MRSYAKSIVAAAMLAVAVTGCQPTTGSGGDQRTTLASPSMAAPSAASPSATQLASGPFKAKGGTVVLDASGDGDIATGTMTVTHETGDFTVDVECARTAQDGRILIGGDTTASTSPYATKGRFTAIVLKPGSPVRAAFGFDVPSNPMASCTAFLDGIVDDPWASTIGPDALEPIEGTVELGR